MSSKQKIWVAVNACLAGTIIYLSLPVLAGAYAIGDRRGPVIYSEGFHTALYIIGWEHSGHEGKPRMAARGNPPRPIFYGL